MLKRLQLVILGVVALQAASVSASEKLQNSPKTPRNPLACSQEARRDSGDFVTVTGLKRSLEKRKEEQNSTMYAYYPWPGGNPEFQYSQTNMVDQMKPWSPHHFWGI